MSYIGTFLIGILVGAVARFLLPGKQSMGWIMTGIMGVLGSFLASYVGAQLGWYPHGGSAGFLASVAGAIIVLVVYGMVVNKQSS